MKLMGRSSCKASSEPFNVVLAEFEGNTKANPTCGLKFSPSVCLNGSTVGVGLQKFFMVKDVLDIVGYLVSLASRH